MPKKTWTHPKHKYPAMAGFLLDITATCFGLFALTVCMFYTSGKKGKDDECSAMLDNDVKCEDQCSYVENQETTNWQRVVYVSTVTAITLNLASVASQLMVFWTGVVMNRVYNAVLTICSYMDFLSGVLKLVASFIFLYKQVEFNQAYMSRKPGALEVRLLPSGYLQFSAILSFLGVVMMWVATDVRSRGQPTHIEIMDKRRKTKQFVDNESKRVSVYKPTSVRILPGLKGMASSTSV